MLQEHSGHGAESSEMIKPSTKLMERELTALGPQRDMQRGFARRATAPPQKTSDVGARD